MTSRVLAALLRSGLLLFFVSACSAERDDVASPRPASTLYLAATIDDDGNRVAMALLTGVDGTVKGYVCPEDPTREEYAGWFSGTVSTTDGTIHLNRQGWSLQATLRPDKAEVTVTSDGGYLMQWSAKPATRGTLSGLYATNDGGCVTGVIVIDDGSSVPMVHGAWCEASTDRVLQVTPALPIALIEGRLPVDIPITPNTRRLFVAPVQTPHVLESLER
jgi:hypothetical protein